MYDNGVMYQNSTVNMADITDGTSTTIMIGESLYPFGVWSQATSCCVRTNIDRTINKPITLTVNSVTSNYWTYWASKHPEPGQFRLLRWHRAAGQCPDQQGHPEQLMTRSGGETISSDQIK